ncbi:SMK killer toxin resistance protein [Teratosphaeriaceae sp. CCFEE 6253]|nr:SMK killer toxin resistance protein [Teratosphaeriaceae sp. CCFEE 6253]
MTAAVRSRARVSDALCDDRVPSSGHILDPEKTSCSGLETGITSDMANTMENLWGSVFESGPTPTLVVATNVTFAALQALLLALLIGTYSIHFAILSILCAGLWYSINWFTHELRQAQAKEEEADRLRKQSAASKERDWKVRGEVADSEADDEGEDTETEHGLAQSSSDIAFSSADFTPQAREQQAVEGAAESASRGGMQGSVQTSGARASEDETSGRLRRPVEQDRSGDVSSSTDSEWEKVDNLR